MNGRAFILLVIKDVRLYFANKFFAFITMLGLVTMTLTYFLLPPSVDETLTLGLYAPQAPRSIMQALDQDGLILNRYGSEQDLISAVRSGTEQVGIVLPENLEARLEAGEKPQAQVYFSASMPEEFSDIYKLMLEELSYLLTGSMLEMNETAETIGPDMAGQQVGMRQRMLPLLAVLVLIMETLGLASLVTAEIETGTLRALLTTPLRVEGFFATKSVTGIGMAFVQVLILLAITGGLKQEPLLILAALLLGCMLMTATSFLVASVARDMMSVMGWGVLAMILLLIPGMNVLLPGLTSQWIKVIPSYYLVTPVYEVLNLNAGWAEVGGSLVTLCAFSLGMYMLGVWAVRRRFA